jgi:hypothetical protein
LSINNHGAYTLSKRGLRSFTPAPLIPLINNAYTFAPTTTYYVANHANFVQPNYSVQVLNASTGAVVVANSAVTKSGAILSFPRPVTGDYLVKVSAQDVNGQPSIPTIGALNMSVFNFPASTFRYWRLTNFTGAVDTQNTPPLIQIATIRFYTLAAGGGVSYPPTMTSYTAPSPYVVSSRYVQGNVTYLSWKAFDASVATYYWTLGSALQPAEHWIQVDLNSPITIRSMLFTQGQAGYLVNGFTIVASDTGAFAGEETTIGVVTNLQMAATANNFIG